MQTPAELVQYAEQRGYTGLDTRAAYTALLYVERAIRTHPIPTVYYPALLRLALFYANADAWLEITQGLESGASNRREKIGSSGIPVSIERQISTLGGVRSQAVYEQEGYTVQTPAPVLPTPTAARTIRVFYATSESSDISAQVGTAQILTETSPTVFTLPARAGGGVGYIYTAVPADVLPTRLLLDGFRYDFEETGDVLLGGQSLSVYRIDSLIATDAELTFEITWTIQTE